LIAEGWEFPVTFWKKDTPEIGEIFEGFRIEEVR
jgi:hypothetical protein